MKRKHKSKKVVQPSMTEAELAKEGIEPQIYKRRWWILGSLCLALFVETIANGSLNMALPDMARDMNLSQLDLTWIVNTYTLLFASLLFVAGAVGDRYGRKRIMQIGLVLFSASSIYAGFFAGSALELIIMRALMGIGGAMIMPATLSIVNNIFPQRERPQAMAVWGTVAGAGMMLGSVVSGLLINLFHWHAIFVASAILTIIALIANHILVPESVDEHKNPVDWLGGLLSFTWVFGLVYGITELPDSLRGAENATNPAFVWGVLAVAVITLVVFIWWERRSKHPMLDMKLFRSSGFSISALILVLAFLALSGIMYGMSILEQSIIGFTPFESALYMIPVLLPMLILSPLVPKLAARFSSRWVISVGLVITAVGLFLMGRMDGSVTYWDIFGYMVIVVIGITLAMTPSTNLLMLVVPKNRSGMGSAMEDTTRELGAALGVALIGSSINAVYNANIREATAQLPPQLVQASQAIEKSLPAAQQAIDQLVKTGALSHPAAEQLLMTAKNTWMNGFGNATLISAGIMLVTAVICMVFFIRKPEEDKIMAASEPHGH